MKSTKMTYPKRPTVIPVLNGRWQYIHPNTMAGSELQLLFGIKKYQNF